MIDIKELDQVSYKFTELGRALADMSEENEKLFSGMKEDLVKVEDVISAMPTKLMAKNFAEMNTISKTIPQLMELHAVVFYKTNETFMGLNSTLLSTRDMFQKFDESYFANLVEARTPLVNVTPSGAVSGKSKNKLDSAKKKKGKTSIIGKEISGVKSKVNQLRSKLHLPTAGTILATGILWMEFGFKKQDRVRAEAGELKNILVTTFGSGVASMVETAKEKMSDLQENLQRKWGVSKKDFQGVVAAMAAGGLSIDQMQGKVDTTLKGFEADNVTFLLGLDKAFELAGGTSAKMMVNLMADYGKSVDEARDSLVRMMGVGKESGVGTLQFVKNVTTAADTLKVLGFDIDAVVDASVALQANFEKMGVPKQFAGKQAAMGMQQIASGMANMSDNWNSLLAKELGYGEGLKGIQEMKEAHTRIMEKRSYEDLMETVLAAVKLADKASGGETAITRNLLEKELGFGFHGAISAIAISDAVKSGDVKKAKKRTKEFYKQTEDSLVTEKEKFSEWQEIMNKWLDGLSQVGQGILIFISKSLAGLIALFKSIPKLWSNFQTGKWEENTKILQDIGKLASLTQDEKDIIVGGFATMKDAAKMAGVNILGDTSKLFTDAWSFGDGDEEEEKKPGFRFGDKTVPILDLGGGKPSPYESLGVSSGNLGKDAPIIQTVMIPSSSPGTYELGQSSIGQGPSMDESINMGGYDWSGGSLSIVSEGVNESGDITVALVGNCPRCGLGFGKSTIYEEYTSSVGMGHIPEVRRERDLNTLATMLASEVDARKPSDLLGAKKKEAVGIAYTALNRMKKSFSQGKSKSLEDVITAGHGFGKQGKDRPYATSREATPESTQLAKEILSGQYQDPTKGATFFFHDTGGKGYGKRGAEEHAVPKFTANKKYKGKENRAYFFGGGGEEAPGWDQEKSKLEAKYEKKHGSEPKDIESNKNPILASR